MQYHCSPGTISMCMGSFDSGADLSLQRTAHIFTSQKVPWYEIEDGAKCFDRFPDGFEGKIDKWKAGSGRSVC